MEISEGRGHDCLFMVSVEDGMGSDGSYRFSIKTMFALSLHHGMSRAELTTASHVKALVSLHTISVLFELLVPLRRPTRTLMKLI